MRVPTEHQSNQTGEILAILIAAKNHPPNENLRIVSDSKYAIDGLTKNLKRWESRGWIDTQHGKLFELTTAWLRWRTGKTHLKWVKGHSGIKGNEEADKLAGNGAKLPLPNTPTPLLPPPNASSDGPSLAKLEQKDLYRIIVNKNPTPIRMKSNKIIDEIKTCTQESFEHRPTTGAIWQATRHKDLTKKTRDFLWKSTQNAHKIGDFWFPISGLQQRGVCPICDEQEDLDHILTKCLSKARSAAWKAANDLWKKKSRTNLPTKLGDILGCCVANPNKDNTTNKGKSRLYRIIMTETAYLIWTLRNERRIRDNDSHESAPEEEVQARWTNAINKRLTIDRFLTDKNRFGKHALDEKLVKTTWSNCLKDEDSLPSDWPTTKTGVLVGISHLAPPRARPAG